MWDENSPQSKQLLWVFLKAFWERGEVWESVQVVPVTLELE